MVIEVVLDDSRFLTVAGHTVGGISGTSNWLSFSNRAGFIVLITFINEDCFMAAVTPPRSTLAS